MAATMVSCQENLCNVIPPERESPNDPETTPGKS